jgi:uncharacterized glyoxalase superfamily protein PhnB
LSYEDCPALLEWLAQAFGFRERVRLPESDGKIGYAEMETDHGVVMLASGPAAYQSPATRCKEYGRVRVWLMVPWVVDGVLVYVDRVDAHHERAQSAGAKILSPRRKMRRMVAFIAPRI